MKANELSAQSAQAIENAQKDVQVINESAAAKPKSAKSLANDESKREMFSKESALRAVKTAFDIPESETRKYILSLSFSPNLFKSLKSEDLDTKSKSGIRFSTWETLNACKRYSELHDLSGEKAAKEQRKAERAAAAEAKKRIEERKRAEREKAQAERDQKAAQHVAVAKAADITKAAEAAEAKRKADAKAARRLAKRNK